jgi:hypothetical protein
MKNNEGKRRKAPIIGDMIFSLLTLPSAMGYIQEYFTNPESPDLLMYLSGTFVMMGIARLFRAFRYREESRLQFVKFLIYGFLMFACSFSGVVFDKTTATRIFVVVYLGSLIVDRVISIYLNRGLRNVILNLIAIFLLGWMLVEMYNELDIVFIMMIIAVLHALVSILSVSFARINLKSLANVARETYAAEIIGGLLLLIFAFSYILRFLEPNMNSLKDGLWYCFAIVTTIGFGDITATTTIGQILSVILGMYGIIVVALITSVIVNYYGEMRREKEEEGK